MSVLSALPFIRGRLPLLQVRTSDCGAICLRMVFQRLGYRVSADEISRQLAIGRDGVSALDLQRVARSYGLEVQGVGFGAHSASQLTAPAILHWSGAHFVVLDRSEALGAWIIDPTFGRRWLDWSSLAASATGIALLFGPGAPDRSVSTGRDLRPSRIWVPYWQLAVLITTALGSFAAGVWLLWAIDGAMGLLGPGKAGYLQCVAAFATFGAMLWLRSSREAQLRDMLQLHLSQQLLAALLATPLSFVLSRSRNDLTRRVHHLPQTTFWLATLAARVGDYAIAFQLLLFVAARTSFGLWVLGATVAYFGLAALAVRSRHHFERALRDVALGSSLKGHLAGIWTTRVAGAAAELQAQWNTLTSDAAARIAFRGRAVVLTDTAAMVAECAVQIAVALGVLMLGSRGGSTFAYHLLAAAAVAHLVTGRRLLAVLEHASTALGHMERLRDSVTAERAPVPIQPPTQLHLSGALVLDSVAFRYGSSPALVFADINLTVAAGECVLIEGPSGAGKSTLAHLLLGLAEPTSGRVLYDGHPVSALPAMVISRQVGGALQNTVPIEGTIADNVRYGKPECSREDMERACALSEMAGDIAAMPLGYETPLLDGGRTVSVGQRDRIMLARALVARPSVVVLDDVLAHLDETMTRRILASLAGLGCTRIIFSTRTLPSLAPHHRIQLCRG